LNAKIIVVSVLVTLFVVAYLGVAAFGQLHYDPSIPLEQQIPTKEMRELVKQYCEQVGDDEQDITKDLVQTGKVNSGYKGLSCDDAREFEERMDRIGSAFEDLQTLGEIEERQEQREQQRQQRQQRQQAEAN
jgi:hypothetical protein